MLTDVGGVASSCSNADEEEVDDIVNRCGDYYDESAVKSDFHDKKMKGRDQSPELLTFWERNTESKWKNGKQ